MKALGLLFLVALALLAFVPAVERSEGMDGRAAVLAQAAGMTFATEHVVAATTQPERIEAIGFNCNRAEYLVIWRVESGGNSDLWGRRASARPAFQWLGEAFAIAATGAPERRAALAFNPHDEEYLVVYEYQWQGADTDILAQRVAGWSGGGSLRGTPFGVGVTPGLESRPAVAYLPSTQHFLVVYELDGDIWARRAARQQQGDGGGETIGVPFAVAFDFARMERQPAVIASTQQSYFLVAYAHEFSPGDFDIRGQRVRGMIGAGEQLLNLPFDIAFTSGSETQPHLAYSQNAQAFLAAWTVTAAGNSDVFGVWLDERVLVGNPALSAPFPIAAGLTTQEATPRVDIDPINNQVAVVLSVTPTNALARLGMLWLNPNPQALPRITRPLHLFPERPFAFAEPRFKLCPNQPSLVIGYTASFTGDQHDAHLLAGGRWSVVLPMIWR